MGSTTVESPQPSSTEIALQQEQLELLREQRAESEMLKPYILAEMGYKEVDGELVALTEDELYSNMTPLEQTNYDLQKSYMEGLVESLPLMNETNQLALERYRKALAGELDVSPALEAELADQQSELEEYLSQRLGPDWRETTAGIQSLSEFNTRAEQLREASRYGELSTSQGLALAQQDRLLNQTQWQNNLSQQTLGNLYGYSNYGGQLFNNYSTAMQPYQYYSGLGLQASMANAQNSSSMYGALGSLGGTGMMAYALKR